MTLAGGDITVWKWLRSTVEHEVHHRGQIYLYLGMLDIPTPPLYGLTSEEVRAKRAGRLTARKRPAPTAEADAARLFLATAVCYPPRCGASPAATAVSVQSIFSLGHKTHT